MSEQPTTDGQGIVWVSPSSLSVTHIFDGEEVVTGGADGQVYIATFVDPVAAEGFLLWAKGRGILVAGVRSGVRRSPEPAGDERKLRIMLAHAYSGSKLYGDDGELQDNSEYPFIDYLRDPVDRIQESIHSRGMNAWVKHNSEQTPLDTDGRPLTKDEP